MSYCRLFFFLFVFLIVSFSTYSNNDSIYYRAVNNFTLNAKFPKGVKPQKSNNNVDVIRFNQKYFVAFRTAPNHFASSETRLYVLSSNNLKDWDLELDINLGGDIREPRFLDFNNKLYLYFFKGGKSKFTFSPEKMFVCEMLSEANWFQKEITELAGYVPWRLKTKNNKIYLSAYYGKDLYKAKHNSDLRLFISDNAFSFVPISTAPQIDTKGAEEGEFEFDEKGDLWGTVRLEGKGSYIIHADKDSLHLWKKYFSKHKYDSALMFKHNKNLYVISRRNIAGTFAKAPKWLSYRLQQKYNLIHYWFGEKVTALFKLNTDTKKLDHILDFPSTGDNAFPALAQATDSSYVFFNYSSDITEKSKFWFQGQLGKTYLYSTEIIFKEP